MYVMQLQHSQPITRAVSDYGQRCNRRTEYGRGVGSIVSDLLAACLRPAVQPVFVPVTNESGVVILTDARHHNHGTHTEGETERGRREGSTEWWSCRYERWESVDAEMGWSTKCSTSNDRTKEVT